MILYKRFTLILIFIFSFGALVSCVSGDDDDSIDDIGSHADDDIDVDDDVDGDVNDDGDDDIDDDVDDDVNDDVNDDVDDDDTTPSSTTTTTSTTPETTTSTTPATTTTTTVATTTTSTTSTMPVARQLCLAERVIVGSLDEDNDGDQFTEAQGDCHDDEAGAYPGAAEILDGVDNNCDGWIDEGLDSDCDGFPDAGAALDEDCNILSGLIYPGAPEIPNDGIDQDCDGADLVPDDQNGVFVAPTGDDGNPGTMAEPKLTVQAGVDLAEAEEKVVFVSGGGYDESVSTSVSIYGYSGFTDGNRAASVDRNYTIKSVGEAAITVEPGANVAIHALILTGGDSADSVHSLIVKGRALVQNCDIRPDTWQSSATESYGILVDGGFAWSHEITYEGSSASKSVAMEVRNGGTLVSYDDWTFFSFGGSDVGYVVSVVSGKAIIDEAFFSVHSDEANLIRVEENGAAIVQDGDFHNDSTPTFLDGMMISGRLTARDTSIWFYSADTQSSAARVYGTASFIDCEFHGGSAPKSYGILSESGSTTYVMSSGIASGSGSEVGGISSTGIFAKGDVRVEDSYIEGIGSCPDLGYHYDTAGLVVEGSAVVQRSTISGGGAETGYGIVNSGVTYCANSVISAWGGGLPEWGDRATGILATDGDMTLVNSLVKLNSSTEPTGLDIRNSATAILINNIIDPGYDSYGYGFYDPSYGFKVQGSVRLINNNIWSDDYHCILVDGDGTELCTPAEVNACDWPGCTEASGNLGVDPLFVDESGIPAYHIDSTSPMRDAGVDPAPWYAGDLADFDFDGDARPYGAGWDIGLDEWWPDGSDE